jgi:hypothetical protein
VLLIASVVCMALAGLPRPAAAQFDITGSYNAIFHEDQPERIPGPSLGDYLGLPINESARAFAEAWEPSRLTVPEHQCRAHSAPYIMRGPLNMRIWDERDAETEQVVAVHIDISNFQQRRTVWMDGRPHPSRFAEHTWMGFSTGAWEGDAGRDDDAHQADVAPAQRPAAKRPGDAHRTVLAARFGVDLRDPH